jgi:hypothetical protein
LLLTHDTAASTGETVALVSEAISAERSPVLGQADNAADAMLFVLV